jgi:hypothetical protein
VNTTELLEAHHRKVLAVLKKLEDGGADAVLLIRELADDLTTQLAAERGRRPVAERVGAEREHDSGYSESHGYGAAHGGPTGPDDAPATANPNPTTSR